MNLQRLIIYLISCLYYFYLF